MRDGPPQSMHLAGNTQTDGQSYLARSAPKAKRNARPAGMSLCGKRETPSRMDKNASTIWPGVHVRRCSPIAGGQSGLARQGDEPGKDQAPGFQARTH